MGAWASILAPGAAWGLNCFLGFPLVTTSRKCHKKALLPSLVWGRHSPCHATKAALAMMNDNHKKRTPLLSPIRGTATAPYHATKAAPTEGLPLLNVVSKRGGLRMGFNKYNLFKMSAARAAGGPRAGAGFLSQKWSVFQRPPHGRAAGH